MPNILVFSRRFLFGIRMIRAWNTNIREKAKSRRFLFVRTAWNDPPDLTVVETRSGFFRWILGIFQWPSDLKDALIELPFLF